MTKLLKTTRIEKEARQKKEDAMFNVGGASFELLVDAVQAAVSASAGAKRIQITTREKRPTQGGYGGRSRVVASFFDGYDLDSIAADEDGAPDLDVRAKALIHKPADSAAKKARP